MIIWGSGGRTVDLGVVGTEDCKVCERQRPFHLYLTYQYDHFYWIFKWITEKKYLKLCEICQRGWQLDTKQVEGSFQKSPIPFMDRLGCLVGIALGIALFLGLTLLLFLASF